MTLERIALVWWEMGDERDSFETWRMIAHFCTGAGSVDDDNRETWFFLNALAWERANVSYAKAA